MDNYAVISAMVDAACRAHVESGKDTTAAAVAVLVARMDGDGNWRGLAHRYINDTFAECASAECVRARALTNELALSTNVPLNQPECFGQMIRFAHAMGAPYSGGPTAEPVPKTPVELVATAIFGWGVARAVERQADESQCIDTAETEVKIARLRGSNARFGVKKDDVKVLTGALGHVESIAKRPWAAQVLRELEVLLNY